MSLRWSKTSGNPSLIRSVNIINLRSFDLIVSDPLIYVWHTGFSKNIFCVLHSDLGSLHQNNLTLFLHQPMQGLQLWGCVQRALSCDRPFLKWTARLIQRIQCKYLQQQETVGKDKSTTTQMGLFTLLPAVKLRPTSRYIFFVFEHPNQ